MGLRQTIGNVINWFLSSAPDTTTSERDRGYTVLRDYVRGDQRRPLKVRTGQADDNIILNFISLVVDRSVSMLFGGGIEFEFQFQKQTTIVGGEQVEPPSAQEALLDETWDANKQQILLHNLAWLGSVYGTCYVKLMPEGIESRANPGKKLTRLVRQNPRQMTIETDPEDIERINCYRSNFKYTTTDSMGRDIEVARMEVIARETSMQKFEEQDENGEAKIVEREAETGNWVIREYVSSALTQGKWQQMGDDVQWPYLFPPILHWQNLPDPENAYGISDIASVVEPQDRYNFVQSNISKIIRFFAHPMRWAKNIIGAIETVDAGPDKMVKFSGTDAALGALEMSSDLSGSRAFALDLRQAIFDLTRTVDLSSITDKIGALTNFGLRVLYKDALDKLGTKQELYGDALVELNHRLLVLADYDGANADGGSVVWPDPLPTDTEAKAVAHVQLVGAGIESKESAQIDLDLDPDTESKRMETAAAGQTNIGAEILKSFSQGR